MQEFINYIGPSGQKGFEMEFKIFEKNLNNLTKNAENLKVEEKECFYPSAVFNTMKELSDGYKFGFTAYMYELKLYMHRPDIAEVIERSCITIGPKAAKAGLGEISKRRHNNDEYISVFSALPKPYKSV